jgi:hypothetical protein
MVRYSVGTGLVIIIISIYFVFLIGIFCLLQVFCFLIRISKEVDREPETNLLIVGLVGETVPSRKSLLVHRKAPQIS